MNTIMKKLKRLLEQNGKAASSSKSNVNTIVLVGEELYIKSIALSLRYNFLGVKKIILKYESDSKFDDVKNYITNEILAHEFKTTQNFIKLLQKKEAEASKTIKLCIDNYAAKKAQLSLFS